MTNATSFWWFDAAGYSIYLRSFFDSDGDGIGDLNGIAERLDYLVDLGINLIWITPFYPSPQADFGYDVTDYCAVDNLYGGQRQFDLLLLEAHQRGIRVLVDLVPNHTSIDHPWFHEARTSPAGETRDRYIWAEAAPDGGAPNNWVSYFGGSAWTFDETAGEYYLHLFLPEQPDLNWRNARVRSEFREILRFWLERGVDGFRVDVAQGLVKDELLRSNPVVAPFDPAGTRETQWASFDHRHDVLQTESQEIFTEWKQICAEYGAVLIGETSVDDPVKFAELLNGDGLDAGFWLAPMHLEWSAESLRRVLSGPLSQVSDARSICWQGSSLDEVRAATRLGGGQQGRERALALTTLLWCLPGIPFLFQGEELGLEQGVVRPDERADQVGPDVSASRDGCRTPIPWEPGPMFGFTTAATSWLPHGGRTDDDTVLVQSEIDGSWLARYKALIGLRKDRGELRFEAVEWLSEDTPHVVSFRRGSVVVLVNAGSEAVSLGHAGEMLFDSFWQLTGSVDRVELHPNQAVVLADVEQREISSSMGYPG